MRLLCGRLEQCGVRSDCLSTKFGCIKIRPVFCFYPQFPAIDFIMSTIAKSTSPTASAATKSRDWTKAPTPELQSGSEDESNILDAKAKECRCCKQVKREEKQCREEAERRRQGLARRRSRRRERRRSARRVSRRRKTGRRCSEGLQRLQRSRERWRRRCRRSEQGRNQRRV